MVRLEQLNAHDFHHVMDEQRGVSLVFFTHALCSSCRAWKKLLQAYINDRDDINLFEVNAETEMALTNEFEVFHLPAMFLYRDGKYHAPLQCAATTEALEQTISRLLQQPARDMP